VVQKASLFVFAHGEEQDIGIKMAMEKDAEDAI
jgi:hypothetical protein